MRRAARLAEALPVAPRCSPSAHRGSSSAALRPARPVRLHGRSPATRRDGSSAGWIEPGSTSRRCVPRRCLIAARCADRGPRRGGGVLDGRRGRVDGERPRGLAATAVEVPVWLVAGRGRRLPVPFIDAISAGWTPSTRRSPGPRVHRRRRTAGRRPRRRGANVPRRARRRMPGGPGSAPSQPMGAWGSDGPRGTPIGCGRSAVGGGGCGGGVGRQGGGGGELVGDLRRGRAGRQPRR